LAFLCASIEGSLFLLLFNKNFFFSLLYFAIDDGEVGGGGGVGSGSS
jgi:hypothetical protein